VKKMLLGMNEIDVNSVKRIGEMSLQNELAKYRKGYEILMEYFDSISDEEKPKVDAELKAAGLL
jgi:hypothetical protein